MSWWGISFQTRTLPGPSRDMLLIAQGPATEGRQVWGTCICTDQATEAVHTLMSNGSDFTWIYLTWIQQIVGLLTSHCVVTKSCQVLNYCVELPGSICQSKEKRSTDECKIAFNLKHSIWDCTSYWRNPFSEEQERCCENLLSSGSCATLAHFYYS